MFRCPECVLGARAGLLRSLSRFVLGALLLLRQLRILLLLLLLHAHSTLVLSSFQLQDFV